MHSLTTQTRRDFLAWITGASVFVTRLPAKNNKSLLYDSEPKIILRVNEDGVTVERFKVIIKVQSQATILSTLETAGLDPVGETEFPARGSESLHGRYYLVQLDNVSALFMASINKEPAFENIGIAEKAVYPGDWLVVEAVGQARLVG